MGFTLLALCGEGEEKHLEVTAAGATEKRRETWERVVFNSLSFIVVSVFWTETTNSITIFFPEKARAVGPERFPSAYLLPPSVMTEHVISRLPPPPPHRANDRSR